MTYTNRKSQLQRHTTTLLLAICGIFALTPMLSATEGLADVNFEALKLAVRDLAKTYPHEYTQGDQYLRELEKYEKLLPEISAGAKESDSAAVEQIVALKRKILLDNPLLDFDRLLVIKRKPLGDPRRRTGDKDNDKGLGKFLGIPQQSSWQLHTMPNTTGWENEIAVLSPLKQDGKLKTLFTPENGGQPLGHIPGRCLRQCPANKGSRGLRPARTDPRSQDRKAAGDTQQGRSYSQRRNRISRECL